MAPPTSRKSAHAKNTPLLPEQPFVVQMVVFLVRIIQLISKQAKNTTNSNSNVFNEKSIQKTPRKVYELHQLNKSPK